MSRLSAKTLAAIAAAGLAIEPVDGGRRFVIRQVLPAGHRATDTAGGFYRSNQPLKSTFAWVRDSFAAARFPTRADAAKVALAYADGADLVERYALPGPHPQDILYPNKIIRDVF